MDFCEHTGNISAAKSVKKKCRYTTLLYHAASDSGACDEVDQWTSSWYSADVLSPTAAFYVVAHLRQLRLLLDWIGWIGLDLSSKYGTSIHISMLCATVQSPQSLLVFTVVCTNIPLQLTDQSKDEKFFTKKYILNTSKKNCHSRTEYVFITIYITTLAATCICFLSTSASCSAGCCRQ